MQVILASGSARRKKLLQSLGIKFNIIPSKINEQKWVQKIKDPEKLVVELAYKKAVDVQLKYFQNKKDFVIIGADTIVVFEGEVLGKPKSRGEAIKMLKMLSGEKHQVLTGMALLRENEKPQKTLTKTEVVFKNLSSQQIADYLDTEVFWDRAGAYGIQDPKCDFVKSYSGSYSNIVGLPLKKLEKMLVFLK